MLSEAVCYRVSHTESGARSECAFPRPAQKQGSILPSTCRQHRLRASGSVGTSCVQLIQERKNKSVGCGNELSGFGLYMKQDLVPVESFSQVTFTQAVRGTAEHSDTGPSCVSRHRGCTVTGQSGRVEEGFTSSLLLKSLNMYVHLELVVTPLTYVKGKVNNAKGLQDQPLTSFIRQNLKSQRTKLQERIYMFLA